MHCCINYLPPGQFLYRRHKGGFPLTYFYKTSEKIAREYTFDDEIIIHQIKLFIKSHSARTPEES